MRGRVDPAPHVIGPRGFAMLMIGIGLATLLAALVQNTYDMRRLRAEYAGVVPLSVARLVAGLIFILGVLAAVAVAFGL